MEEVELKLDANNNGQFYISGNGHLVAEMSIGISGNFLTAYHTEVMPEAEGKGLAKKLLSVMVEYARSHGLKVIALCPFVLAQFKRHADQYADIWQK